MSHETVSGDRQHVYVLPSLPSDMLRTSQFSEFFAGYRGPSIAVRTADGWRWSSSRGRAAGLTAIFSSAKLLDAVIADPTDTTLGRAFVNGDLRLEGDILQILAVSSYVFASCGRLVGNIPHQIGRAFALPQRRLRAGRRPTVHDHLFSEPDELSLDFFRGWLGPTLAPTCARWTEARETDQDHKLLDQAQASELSDICRTLELRPGDRLVDLECEWGALLIHAVRHGKIEARGVSSCERQAEMVRDRIQEAGLERQCTAEAGSAQRLFRAGSFGKAVDLSIFQHVSCRALPRHLNQVSRLLEPDGLFLTQRITCSSHAKGPGDYFLEGHTFPGGEVATLPEELAVAEQSGFEVMSVESIRNAYERTLRLWIGRLESNACSLTRRASGRSYRRWLLYLTEAAAAFQSRDLAVHRILLRRVRPAARRSFLH